MMPTLDVVLQTPAPRPTATNRGKGELEKEGQASGGFDDVLAQSGAKDEPTVAEAEQDAKSPRALPVKAQRDFDLSKGQAQPPSDVSMANRGLAEEMSVDMQTIDGKSIATALPTFNDKLGAGLNFGIPDAATQIPDPLPNTEDALPATKIQVLLAKALNGVAAKDAGLPVTAGALEKPEKSEKLEKTIKASTDKKAATLEEDDKSVEGGNGIKTLLDILGSPTNISPVNGEPQQTTQMVTQQAMPDETMASMLQVVSPQASGARDRQVDGAVDKKTAKSSSLPDQSDAGDADKIFRFSRADGTDKPVELKLSAKDKSSDQSEVASAPQSKTENIVVLEARRYLALAPESNAFNLVSQIAGDKELSNALTSSIIDPAKSAATSKVVNTLKLQMTPHDLGTVTATLRLRGDELSVAITVQNSAAYSQLTTDQDKMVEALRAQGFAVDQVTVQLVSADRSTSQDQQSQSSSQGQQQQEARNGASAQQGRQQGNGASQDNPSNRNWQNFDTAANSSAVPGGIGVADRRDGQVYI